MYEGDDKGMTSKEATCKVCPGMTCTVVLPDDIPDKVPQTLLTKYCNLVGVCIRKDKGCVPKWKRGE